MLRADAPSNNNNNDEAKENLAKAFDFIAAIKEIMQKIVEFLMKVLNIKYGEDKPTVAE